MRTVDRRQLTVDSSTGVDWRRYYCLRSTVYCLLPLMVAVCGCADRFQTVRPGADLQTAGVARAVSVAPIPSDLAWLGDGLRLFEGLGAARRNLAEFRQHKSASGTGSGKRLIARQRRVPALGAGGEQGSRHRRGSGQSTSCAS